jgi:hypothetical protein
MKKSDSVVVNDGSGRRRFIRVGAAFLLAQSAAARAQDDAQNFRTDCDSQGYSGQKNAEAAGNDSDTGATADRPGCGRRLPLTQLNDRKTSPVATRPAASKKISVTKIKA